jgi:hypothetical protein
MAERGKRGEKREEMYWMWYCGLRCMCFLWSRCCLHSISGRDVARSSTSCCNPPIKSSQAMVGKYFPVLTADSIKRAGLRLHQAAQAETTPRPLLSSAWALWRLAPRGMRRDESRRAGSGTTRHGRACADARNFGLRQAQGTRRRVFVMLPQLAPVEVEAPRRPRDIVGFK